MRSRPEVILDFDGTLVLENSSQVFEEVLFSRWTGPRAFLMRQLYQGPLRPLGQIFFQVMGRMLGTRDARLWILIHLARPLILKQHRALYWETAARLTINEELAGRYSRPFAILSIGLEPVIRAFLAARPELPVTDIIASQLVIDRTRCHTALRTMKSKVEVLRMYRPRHYLTDYSHEARIISEQLHEYTVDERLLANKQPIYVFEVRG